MIHDGGVLYAEAKTSASAATSGAAAVFEAHPLLLSGTNPPAITKVNETFLVCNTSSSDIQVGDRIAVTRTMQGHFVVLSGSGGGSSIQGKLASLADGTGEFTGLKVGQVAVEVTNCGGDSLIGSTVSVVDWSGCIFDEPIDTLLNVWVFASKGVGLSQDPAAGSDERTSCHWIADNRCCPPTGGYY